MKNQELQSSLIKSGIILILTIFFIYAFAVDDSGGVTGTIASIFSGILFILGLTLALAVSVIVMFGIYFGILYLYDQDTCKKTYGEFKAKLADSSQYLSSSCSSICSSTKETIVPLQEEDLKPLLQNQNNLGDQLSNLQDSIQSLENSLIALSTSVKTTGEDIARLDEKAAETDETLESKATTASVDEAAKKLGADITNLQTSVKPLGEKLAELEASISSLGGEEDTTSEDLQEKVDSALNGMQEEMTSIKQSIEALLSQPQEKKDKEEEEEESHKILGYFSVKADKNKFIKLVNEAVSKEMTYAQTGEFLNDSLSAAASEVIADHPSLTKDYIKICRQKD